MFKVKEFTVLGFRGKVGKYVFVTIPDGLVSELVFCSILVNAKSLPKTLDLQPQALNPQP